MRHTQIVYQTAPSQSGAIRHPISCLSAFQPIYNEFGHCKPVQFSEHTRSSPLQRTFEQSKIKTWLLNQLLTIATAQILKEGFHENGWPSLIETTDTSSPSASTNQPNAETSWWGSLLWRSKVATQTLRKMSLSQVRRKNRTSSPCSSNSTLQLPCDFAQLMLRDKIQGSIPFRMVY